MQMHTQLEVVKYRLPQFLASLRKNDNYPLCYFFFKFFFECQNRFMAMDL